MSVYQAVIDLVGTPPAGFEILVWIFSALFLLFLVKSAFSVLYSVLGWIGGK